MEKRMRKSAHAISADIHANHVGRESLPCREAPAVLEGAWPHTGEAIGSASEGLRGQFGASGEKPLWPQSGNSHRLPQLRKPGEFQRRGGDSNPRDGHPSTAFPVLLLQPLGHLSRCFGSPGGFAPRPGRGGEIMAILEAIVKFSCWNGRLEKRKSDIRRG